MPRSDPSRLPTPATRCRSSPATQGVKSQRWQVSIQPTAKGFTFTQEVSEGGTPWTINAQFEYLRLP